MNDALFWALLKQEKKKIIGLSLGITFYEWLITWVYPILLRSPAIKEIPDLFPSAVKQAFGVSTTEGDLSYEAYITAQLLGRLWPLLITFYGINTANSVIHRPIEQGEISFPLSAPITRSTIFSTQLGVLCTALAFISGAALGGIYSATAYWDITISRWHYFRLQILTLLLSVTLSAYTLLISFLFNSQERAVGWAAGLILMFYGLDVVSDLSESFKWLRNFTPLGLFRPQEVLQKNVLPRKAFTFLSISCAVSLALTRLLYSRRDFPV